MLTALIGSLIDIAIIVLFVFIIIGLRKLVNSPDVRTSTIAMPLERVMSVILEFAKQNNYRIVKTDSVSGVIVLSKSYQWGFLYFRFLISVKEVNGITSIEIRGEDTLFNISNSIRIYRDECNQGIRKALMDAA